MLKNIPFLLIVIGVVNLSLYGQTFIKDFYSITELVEAGDKSFFVANDLVHGNEIWVTDGTTKGTILVKDIYRGDYGSNPANLFVFNNELYFSANDGINGTELWKTDGTETGTVLVKNIHEALSQSSNPRGFTIYNNELYFLAKDLYLSNGYELWKTDGSEAGTIKVYETKPKDISSLIVANNKLYLYYNGLQIFNPNTAELSKIDIDDFNLIYELNTFNDELYFVTSDSYYGRSFRLYRLGGDDTPVLLQDFSEPQYGSIDIHNLTQVANEIYFSITTDFNSSPDRDVLWKTDGSYEGTKPIKAFEWERHLSESNISDFIAFNNELFFNSGSQNNYKIWRSDGTGQGTKQAYDIRESRSTDLFIQDGLLYLFNNEKLWTVDGTDSGVMEYSEFNVSDKNSDDYFNAQPAIGKVFFEGFYLDKKALFSTEFQPIISVKYDNYAIESNHNRYLESKIDSVVKRTVEVKNIGNKDLAFSEISISGKDFYIEGNQGNNISETNKEGYFEQVLPPNKQSEFEVLFYPSSIGAKSAYLKILSNDITFPQFNIQFLGNGEGEANTLQEDEVSLDKDIFFGSKEGVIALDNSFIKENQGVNEIIGKLLVGESALYYTYELVSGEGDTDNDAFKIEMDQLKTNVVFDYEIKNTYSIRVKATSSDSTQTIESQIIVGVINQTENQVLSNCSPEVSNVAFGFYDVEFLDDQSVIAVGTHGVILKSNNSGKDWRIVRRESYDNLQFYLNLQFPTKDVGYVIGNKKLLKTEDGGETWFPLMLPDESYPFPRNLFFINEKVGFVFGEEGKLFKTTDGGVYWKQWNLGINTISAAYFFNDSKGYIALDEVLMQTLNGGEDWAEIVIEVEGLRSGFKITNIEFVNEQIGYVTGNRGEILKTEDGGGSWSLISVIEYPSGISDILFFDENHGYVVANAIYETKDGGLSWGEIEHSVGFEEINSIAASDNEEHISAVGISSGGGVYDVGGIIKYKNINSSWQLVSSLRGNYNINSVYFDGDVGYVIGQYEARKTVDGGATWQEFNLPELQVKQFEIVNNTMYILGQNTLHKSIDNGVTWVALGNTTYFRELFFIDELNIFAYDSERGVFKSIDGGVSWVNVHSDTFGILDVYFINKNKGFAGGIGGMVKTEDGGVTWNDVSLDLEDGYTLKSINFFDDMIGFVGSGGILHKTTDGGLTWEKIYTIIQRDITYIHPINDLEWYAIGVFGGTSVLYKSEDGGYTWDKQHIEGANLLDTHMDSNILYGVGSGSFIKLDLKDSPSIASPIKGSQYTSEQSKEVYQILNQSNGNYKWEVTGDNEISSTNNSAEVFWKSSGFYTLTVTPINECGEGVVRELTVQVEEVAAEPIIIEGNVEVEEFSLNNRYTTLLSDDSRYSWFADNYETLNPDNNNVDIDWGIQGDAKVQVIKTNKNSGIRQKAVLNVIINPFDLPSSNFSIQAIGETCPNKNDAQIIILATEVHDYELTINGVDYSFTQDLTIEDLPPNSYEFCIKIQKYAFEQCYNVLLEEAANVTGKSSVKLGKVSFDINKGTPPYTVSKNGEMILKTMSSSFSVLAGYGDQIEVATDKSCEGKMSTTVNLIDEITVYPNPTSGSFEIVMPISQKEIIIDLYSIQSQLISTSTYKIINGKVKLDINDKPDGIYFVKVFLEEPVTLKIIKQ